MPRQVIARVVLVFAVLLAQQTALAHDFWHAAGAQSSAQSKNPDGKKLCDLHDLLGTVLGVACAAVPQVPLLRFSEVGFVPFVSPAAPSRALPAQSRGPPLPS